MKPRETRMRPLRAELLVSFLLLSLASLAARAGAGAVSSTAEGGRKLRLGKRDASEISRGSDAASAQGKRQPAFQSENSGRGSRGVRPGNQAATSGRGAGGAATRAALAERQTLSISIDMEPAPSPGAAATLITPPPPAAQAGRSQLPASAPTTAVPLPQPSQPQPPQPPPSRPQPSPPQFTVTDDGYYFFEGTGSAVLTPAKQPAPRPPPKPPTVRKPTVRKSPVLRKSPKLVATPNPSPSPGPAPGGGSSASGMFPNPALPPIPLDLSATFPGPTTTIPSIVPSTDSSPSPSPTPDGQTDDRQAELPALPRPLASPRPPPLAPPPPLVPPPGTTSGAWPLIVPVPLPPRWDSRDKRLTAGVSIISRVRFQASCNACVAFTVIAAAESAYALGARRAATNLDFSEQALFFCNADIASRPPDCSVGWVLPDALHVLSQRGVRQERCYVYDVTRGAAVCGPAGAEERDTLPGGEDATAAGSSSSDSSNSSNGSSDSGSTNATSSTRAAVVSPAPTSACDPVPGRWEVVAREWYGVESANATAAKEMVAGTGSAMTCFKLYADMYSHPGGMYRWDGESAWLGWHCAQLVGWSDDGGWWLFKSSWGTEVADKGFFKVAYGEAEVLAWGVYGLIWRP